MSTSLRFHVWCWLLLVAVATAATTYKIETIAGGDWVGDGGPAVRALLLQAEGIAADMNGNVYVADAAGHRVRRISAAGIITTVAGNGARGFAGDGGPAVDAQLDSPYGLAFDSRGNLYIADLTNARVRRVAANGIITTIAGGGALPAGGVNDGSLATSVALIAPRNLALDPGGDLYISDFAAHRVHRLSSDGSLTTAAGTGIAGFLGDGIAGPLARLAFPSALTVDRDGVVYIADSGNHLLRKLTRGVLTTMTRTGTPTGLAIDGAGMLYVADRSAGHILRISKAGATSTLAVLARDVAFGADGNAYAPDGDVVRRVTPAGAISVIAGGGRDGPRLNHPTGVAANASGEIYIADRDNHRVRRVAADGTSTTVAAFDGLLNSPSAVTVDPLGNLVVTDTGNRRILIANPTGVITGVVNVGLNNPVYAVADRAGQVYIADAGLGRIVRASPGHTPVVLLTNVSTPRGLALDTLGNLYFTEADSGRVRKLAPTGEVANLADGAWNIPRGVAVDRDGNVFVADTGLQRVLRVDPSGAVVPIAGNGTPGFSGDGGPALGAQLGFPWDVAVAPDHTLLVADFDTHRVRRLTPTIEIAPPAIRSLELLNAASLAPGPIAPGMLLALRSTGATSADGVEVRFDKTAVPILSASAAQLVVQVPAAIASQESVQVEVRNGDNLAGSATAAVTSASPALFADSFGRAAATNADGSLNSASNPAARGSIVTLYGTGEGVGGFNLSVTLGAIAAEVLYAGPVFGYPGLLQLNVRVPGGYYAPGVLPLSLIVGLFSSQPGITIAVQ